MKLCSFTLYKGFVICELQILFISNVSKNRAYRHSISAWRKGFFHTCCGTLSYLWRNTKSCPKSFHRPTGRSTHLSLFQLLFSVSIPMSGYWPNSDRRETNKQTKLTSTLLSNFKLFLKGVDWLCKENSFLFGVGLKHSIRLTRLIENRKLYGLKSVY